MGAEALPLLGLYMTSLPALKFKLPALMATAESGTAPEAASSNTE